MYCFINPNISLISTSSGPKLFGLVRFHCIVWGPAPGNTVGGGGGGGGSGVGGEDSPWEGGEDDS